MLQKDVLSLLSWKIVTLENCFHALCDFLERSLRFWIIQEELIRVCLQFSTSQ